MKTKMTKANATTRRRRAIYWTYRMLTELEKDIRNNSISRDIMDAKRRVLGRIKAPYSFCPLCHYTDEQGCSVCPLPQEVNCYAHDAPYQVINCYVSRRECSKSDAYEAIRIIKKHLKKAWR